LKHVVGDAEPEIIHQRTVKLYVRRGNGFVLAEDEELIGGEHFYRKRPTGGFQRTGKVVPKNEA
jgi:hypothetical protein